ncbi:MAG TPA: hypothetical protein VG015_08960, partial [Candidatus Dormibacteraeota bacterium]|nr:hypothetical protein [Candidatus Dormibacteraeota bacterium]
LKTLEPLSARVLSWLQHTPPGLKQIHSLHQFATPEWTIQKAFDFEGLPWASRLFMSPVPYSARNPA